jgi:hypothetical protein
LERAIEAGAPLTETGNLARALVVEGHRLFNWFGRTARSESDVMELWTLRDLAKQLDLVRRSGRKLVLTPAGRTVHTGGTETLWQATVDNLLGPTTLPPRPARSHSCCSSTDLMATPSGRGRRSSRCRTRPRPGRHGRYGGGWSSGCPPGPTIVRASTLRGYREHARHYLIPLLGHLRLAAVRPAHVQAAFRSSPPARPARVDCSLRPLWIGSGRHCARRWRTRSGRV